MPNITVLPVSLRNKIAAGEVVERPASVVKELLENSIDAESSKIEVNIARAGRKLIRVSDNGTGMDREDAILAFERYATSKIKDEAGLFNIKTLGFRGEALSSISSVSRIKLSTVFKGTAEFQDTLTVGTCIEMEAGELKEIKECPALGTIIEVRDLFFNTPARRKFLKSDNTENHHIIDIVTKEAIARHKIAFILTMDGQEVMNIPAASSKKERLFQIFGKDFVDELIEIEAEYSRMHVKAFLSGNTKFRGNKTNQFIFINKRPVRDHAISQAVYKSYGDIIPRDRHPVFFLFIQIPPEIVDFNVHPAKREVRFADKSSLFSFINGTLEQAIRRAAHHPDGMMKIPDSYASPIQFYTQTSGLNYQEVAEHPQLYCLDYSENMPYIYLGETFVAIPDKDGLTILDYHAAHERINYERLLKKIELPSYRLLFPQNIKLDAGEYRIILENIEMLHEFGFDIEDFGHESVIVRSLPGFLNDADLKSLLGDIAATIISESGSSMNLAPAEIDSARSMLAAKIACHSSMRGKEVPDGRRIAVLLKDLCLTDYPNNCPHGRPTKITISMGELRRMFKK